MAALRRKRRIGRSRFGGIARIYRIPWRSTQNCPMIANWESSRIARKTELKGLAVRCVSSWSCWSLATVGCLPLLLLRSREACLVTTCLGFCLRRQIHLEHLKLRQSICKMLQSLESMWTKPNSRIGSRSFVCFAAQLYTNQGFSSKCLYHIPNHE